MFWRERKVQKYLNPLSRVFFGKLVVPYLVKKFPALYETPNIHYRVHNSPSSCPCPGPDQSTSLSYFLKIHFNIILPSTPRSSKLFLSFRFPYQNPVSISSLPIRATCSAHLILFDFVTRIISGGKYKSWSLWLCCFVHSPFDTSL